jgi:hypothetical protein
MKKDVLLMAIWFLFFFGLSPAFSGERSQNSKDQALYEAYNPKGEYVGTIKKEKTRFIFWDKDEINLREKDKNEWEIMPHQKKAEKEWDMYNQKDEFVGTLIKKEGNFKIYDKDKKYIGVIIESNKLLVKPRKPSPFAPEAAKLYLDVLEAIEKIE